MSHEEENIELTQRVTELEIKEEKAEAQKRIAWMAMGSMLAFTAWGQC
jgi:hypothetical protein